jgi:hypothetical protein
MTIFSPGLLNVVSVLAQTSRVFAIPDCFRIVGTPFSYLWHDMRLSRVLLPRQLEESVFNPSMPRPMSSRWQWNSMQT